MTPAVGNHRPRFSIVTAVYNVERYLPDFIASMEGQRFPLERVEVIAVNDGSTDGSLAVLEAWARSSAAQVHVVTKPNGGQGSARNLGLEQASGEWVTFPDPDDLLEPDYLGAADRFAEAHPEVEAMSARPVILNDATGRRNPNHPRRWQYRDGSRVDNLLDEPNVFFGLAPGSFFRLDRIQARELRFDTRIRPNFEDGHFAARFLLAQGRPLIGLLRDSVYLYRKRADSSSTMQTSMAHPGRYGAVPELGYLDLLERSRREDGSVPPWIQQLIVYELSWYLSEDAKISSPVVLPPELAPGFHELLDRILRLLDPAVVAVHGVRRLQRVWLDLLAHAGRDVPWHASRALVTGRDPAMGLRRVQYRFVGALPTEALTAGGRPTQPAFTKTMAHRFFHRDFLWERILWLPDREDLRLELDGSPVPIVEIAEPLPTIGRPRVPRSRARRLLRLARKPRKTLRKIRRRARRLRDRLAARPIQVAARALPFRRRFRDAWVLMDRIHDADDNGERLFEHLRAARPDVNAWFVIERGSPDWDRLRATHRGRVVAHGSWTWRLLMLNAVWLLSSHIDVPIANPPLLRNLVRRPTWKLAFLQHGVIKDDLSRWLNHRELELFVVSTEAELASIAADGTPYRFGAKETRLTGLPRFDRLLAKGRAVREEDRSLVLVAPTWRQWLAAPLATGSQRRSLDVAFWESDYIRSWTALLRSERIGAALARRGWRLGFMPHPNLQSMLPQLDLPAHVEPLSFSGTDVQDLYARTALLVTDYSSVAFNTAYLNRPVVYFQFDRDRMLGGAHVGRAGYFEYERDGFGPVALDVDAAEQAILESIEHGPTPAPVYADRIRATFPERDGQACARVVAAVEELSRPWRLAPGDAPGDPSVGAEGTRPAT